MTLKLFWSLVTGLTLALHVSCYTHSARELGKEKITSYDSIVLSRIWSPAYCWDFSRKWNGENITCSPCRSSAMQNRWTIHGLWPSNVEGGSPSYCDNVKYQSSSLTKNLRTQLESKWPSMHGNNDAFWSFEWKKHGSCLREKAASDRVFAYFSKTIKLHDRYDVGKALEQGNLDPGASYSFDKLYRALKDDFGANAFLHCKKDPETGEQFLDEVKVCLDSTSRIMDCAPDDGYVSNCKPRFRVIYAKDC